MQVGHARVSTLDQSPQAQIVALHAAGCERKFTEQVSGAQHDRPEHRAALNYVRAGDTLMAWKPDRLARSVRQLVDTADVLAKREIGLEVLTQAIDTTSRGGRLVFHIFAAVAEFELVLERTELLRHVRGYVLRRPFHGARGRRARRRPRSAADRPSENPRPCATGRAWAETAPIPDPVKGTRSGRPRAGR